MIAEEELIDLLTGAPSVTALVGDRIDPEVAPEPVLPAIAFNNPETDYVKTIHDNLPVAVKPSIEIWCMGRTRKEADDIARAVIPVIAPSSFIVADRRSTLIEGPPLSYVAVLTVEFYEV